MRTDTMTLQELRSKLFHTNPITKCLYSHGFDGLQDVYEFWLEKKDAVLADYKTKVDAETYENNKTTFEYQVRWSSVYGIFFKLELSLFVGRQSSGMTSLEDVKMKAGNTPMSIVDYAKKTDPYDNPVDRTDLRGIGIIGATVSNITIRDVSFDYGLLCFSTFKNVTFINCHFQHTSFAYSKLINCTFEQSNLLCDNDMSETIIDSTFDCPIENPTIKDMKIRYLTAKRIQHYLKYPSFTIILNPSFVKQSPSEQVQDLYERQEPFRKVQ